METRNCFTCKHEPDWEATDPLEVTFAGVCCAMERTFSLFTKKVSRKGTVLSFDGREIADCRIWVAKDCPAPKDSGAENIVEQIRVIAEAERAQSRICDEITVQLLGRFVELTAEQGFSEHQQYIAFQMVRVRFHNLGNNIFRQTEPLYQPPRPTFSLGK